MEYTKGDWLERHGDIWCNHQERIAQTDSLGLERIDEAVGNARLIAAAPDLLASLKNMVATADSPLFSDAPQLVALKQARAAIAKAEDTP